MMSILYNAYRFILTIFGKGKRAKENESQEIFYTPSRAHSRANFKVPHEQGNVNSYPQRGPSRLPKSFPLTRNPSQIGCLGSRVNKNTPFRPQPVTRLQGMKNDAFDVRQAESFLDLRANRSSPSTLDFHSAAEDRQLMSSNDTMDFGESLSMRELRLRNFLHLLPGESTTLPNSNLTYTDVRGRRSSSVPDNRRLSEPCSTVRTPSVTSLLGSSKHMPRWTKGITRARGSSTNLRNMMVDNSVDCNFLESGNRPTRREDLTRDFRRGPRSSSLELPSSAENQFGMHLDESSANDAFTTRYLEPRNKTRSNSARCLPHKPVCSKIPICTQGRRVHPKSAEFMISSKHDRGKHTLGSIKRDSYGVPGFQGHGDIAETGCIRSDDVSNWITFRTDTITKFERMFKTLSKRKHHSSGNIMDSNLHAQWMAVVGIKVDKDATIFKNFAGRKIVLTYAEYKSLLHKICTTHELDYWDVLRKMATFQEEFEHEERVALFADVV